MAKPTKNAGANETPLMKQYSQMKAKYPDAILLFRVGDFYETFGTDAITTAATLGITLTKRHNGSSSEIELAGFPYHALDTYLPKLVRAGYRIAVCDQLEDPSKTKTLVKRGITELITPGSATDEKMLEFNKNNYLAAIHFAPNGFFGIAFTDLSTGEFLAAEGNTEHIDKLLQSFAPSEIVFSKKLQKEFLQTFGNKYYTYPIDEWVFAADYTRETLLRHFKVQSLKGFGVEDLPLANIAAGAILHYLKETEHPNLLHLTTLSRIQQDKYVWLDKFTIRNLELIDSPNENATPLIKILDKTVSPMGARLLRKWLVLPLKNIDSINERLDIVEFITKNPAFADQLWQNLKLIGDLERLIAKVALKRINPREVMQIKKALNAIVVIKKIIEDTGLASLQKIGEQLNPCISISQKIEKELVSDPPLAVGKADVIQAGVHAELDELRLLLHSNKEQLQQIQEREIKSTGITSLKIGFNSVFGYYLEVTNRFKDQVPTNWIRRQTLAAAERYISTELKQFEEKILGAEEKILGIENQLFEQLVQALHDYLRPIQLNAALIAKLDCMWALAKVAIQNNYCKPIVNQSLIIDLQENRHPVIEQNIGLGESFVPNNIFLNSEDEQVLIITGPNMAGKSALLRQTALTVIMAQMGSFVPATSAVMGVTDKIFTRVGASDNLSLGESTFMVEMNETASIMNNLSENSLILLDEIGRGTSTYDGISIAWALAEFLHSHPQNLRPKTLFATHYHELTALADTYPRIKNYSVAIKETDSRIIFMRKLIKGASEKSFGIHVAQMAGMPTAIISRANQILTELEEQKKEQPIENQQNKTDKQTHPQLLPNPQNALQKAQDKRQQTGYQLNVFEVGNPQFFKIKNFLDKTDLNTLTPVEALFKLHELKKMLEEK